MATKALPLPIEVGLDLIGLWRVRTVLCQSDRWVHPKHVRGSVREPWGKTNKQIDLGVIEARRECEVLQHEIRQAVLVYDRELKTPCIQPVAVFLLCNTSS